MRITKSCGVFLALLLAAAVAAPPAVAQPHQTGTLRIVVKDPSGAVIPNATVTVSGAEPATRGLVIPDVQSDGQGVATVPNLPAGRYTVSAAFPGFERRALPDVRIRGGETRRDISLPIEKVAESVAVGRDVATSASDPKSDRFSN